jgi:hypothetical protein
MNDIIVRFGQSIFVQARTTTICALPQYRGNRELVDRVMNAYSNRREYYSDICPNVYEKD